MAKKSVCEIITLAGKFTSELDIQKYCNQQFETIQNQTEIIKQLNEKVTHLEELLSQTNQLTKVEAVVLSPEEGLIDRQIEILRARGLGNSELTLEDTKKLDLLIKNKKILKELNPQTFEGQMKKLDSTKFSTAQLLEIASSRKDEVYE